MKKIIQTIENLYWVAGGENTVEIFLSDEMPDASLCTAVHTFVFKDNKFLQTETREGERWFRQLDVPGGHIDEGETPEEAGIRETLEETGVRIKNTRLVAYIKITSHGEKPEILKYPFPTSYILFYLCDFESEEPFEGNEETHGRVWLPFDEFEKSKWCVENKVFLEEVMKSLNKYEKKS